MYPKLPHFPPPVPINSTLLISLGYLLGPSLPSVQLPFSWLPRLNYYFLSLLLHWWVKNKPKDSYGHSQLLSSSFPVEVSSWTFDISFLFLKCGCWGGRACAISGLLEFTPVGQQSDKGQGPHCFVREWRHPELCSTALWECYLGGDGVLGRASGQ